MNTHPIPPAPELKDLASYLDKLPPMISRKKVAYFTGGAVSPKKLPVQGAACPAEDRGNRRISDTLSSGLP